MKEFDNHYTEVGGIHFDVYVQNNSKIMQLIQW